MDDAEFQGWMRRVAAVQLDTPPVSANAIWWRAELRRRLIAEDSRRGDPVGAESRKGSCPSLAYNQPAP